MHDLAIRHSSHSRAGTSPVFCTQCHLDQGPRGACIPSTVVCRHTYSGSTGNWNDGFLPSNYQGVLLRSEGDTILHLSNPSGVTPEMQRADLDLIRELNHEHLARTGDQEIAVRVESYELAFRMQHRRRT